MTEVRKLFQNKVEKLILFDFDNYYKDDTFIKTGWFGEGIDIYFKGIE